MRLRMTSIAAACALLVACSDDDGGQQSNNNNFTRQGVCGDGTLDTGEECDNGTDNSDSLPNACRTNCVAAYCGDWALDASELCDNGPQNGRSPNTCRADCTPNVCGDGYVGGDEVCDDGNTVDDNQCRGDCGQNMALCGNGAVDPGEGCDDAGGNSDTIPDACRTDCQPARCGDDVEDSGENCDDGNTIDDLDCSADCENFCGDNVFNPSLGEECDRGPDNGVSPADCLDDCTLTTCGDGHRGGNEGCDDGDNDGGDGCSADCRVEDRWQCQGSPSICSCAGFNLGASCAQCVVFVSSQPTSPQLDGRSWATAFPTVQQGLDAAYQAGPDCEVWVAQGQYFIYRHTLLDTVNLRDGVDLYGGFAGTETQRDQRDPATFETILDGRAAPGSPTRVLHVVSAMTTQDATLDGFTITGGLAAGGEHADGGGLHAVGAWLTIRNTTFDSNEAAARGAGLFASLSSLTLEGCAFTRNVTTEYGDYQSPYGGAGAFLEYSEATFTDCRFVDNSSRDHGGGVQTDTSQLALNRCELVGNSADRGGGGVSVLDSSYALTACTLVGNTADEGGGLENGSGSSGTLTDCIIADNTADEGGGVYDKYGDSMHLIGCTFADNRALIWVGGGVYSWGDATLSGCVFTNNSAAMHGGGADIERGAIENCVFAGNTAEKDGGAVLASFDASLSGSVFVGNTAERGGGLYVYQSDDFTVSNCTFHGNHAAFGGGIYYYTFWSSQVPSLRNSVIWGNTATVGPAIFGHGDPPLVEYCSVQGGFPGAGNIQTDPRFAAEPALRESGSWSAVTHDSTSLTTVLTDTAASWAPDALVGLFVQPDRADPRMFPITGNTAQQLRVPANVAAIAAQGDAYQLIDLHLSADSPCIDAGDNADAPANDIEGRPRVDGPADNSGVGPPWVDLGAYEHYLPGSSETDCGDGWNNDYDEGADCADPDCQSLAPCEVTEQSCADGLDNDGDGAIDCQDDHCDGDGSCESPEQSCADSQDNDGDGLTDCADPDCSAVSPCEYPEATCGDGVDNDGDGLVDGQDLQDCLSIWEETFDSDPTAWTLTGEWEWGTPSLVGPSSCFSGSCLGVDLDDFYDPAGGSWGNCAATSPPIDLGGTSAPTLYFRAYLSANTYDGGNLKISTDGVNFAVHSEVSPAYNEYEAGQSNWGGLTCSFCSQWSLFQIDLSAYANQTIWLRFDFRADNLNEWEGWYIDELFITD